MTKINTLSRTADKEVGKTTQWLGGLALGLSLSLLASGEAQAANFTFTKIADTSGPILSFQSAGAINDSGTVAFTASLKSFRIGVFTGSGGGLTTIVSRPPYGAELSSPDINNAGTVVFSENVAKIKSVLTGNGGNLTTILSSDGTGLSVGTPSINDQGDVVFSVYSEYLRRGTVVGTGSFGDIFIEGRASIQPAINNRGTVVFAFSQTPLGPLTGTFIKKSDGEIITISPNFIRELAINDNDTVAFAGGGIVISSNGATTTTIVEINGPPAINNSDAVAFLGSPDSTSPRRYGLFTGREQFEPVITIGDSLFGSTVTNLSFSNRGLNNSGQLAFLASFADGTSGIFRANPVSEPSTSVPEPASVFSLLVFGAGFLCQSQKKIKQ